MYDVECEFLQSLATGKRVLEIGTHHGRSASALASSALSVVTVDTYKGDPQIGAPSLALAQENLSAFKNIELIVGDWREQTIDPENYDLIFYDGCHTEEGAFLSRLLQYRGIIAIHDYKPAEPDMRHVVEAADAFAADTSRPLLHGAGSIVWFDAL